MTGPRLTGVLRGNIETDSEGDETYYLGVAGRRRGPTTSGTVRQSTPPAWRSAELSSDRHIIFAVRDADGAVICPHPTSRPDAPA